MPASTNIDDLMLRWEAARQEGRRLTVEELCADCPQLSDELCQRIRAVEAMEQVLGIHSDPERTLLRDSHEAGVNSAHVLPRIPGYEIVRVVDQGGMGIVYEARQVELGRTVAVKMVSSLQLGPTLLARFRSEAEASARLQHPNFVQVFEVGQVNGRPYFSMEYVEGGSLAQQLARERPPPARAAELVETLARAIHAAHERGIVHRDLKPSNVMLTAQGIPKITDFGLAKRLDEVSSHTQSGEVLGTPSYMAPEQAHGHREQIGPATDVYALGAILYELLAGQPPFRGTSALDSLRLLTTQEPIAPSRLAPSIPRDLEAICLKCLEKAPAFRYRSALELAEDLRRFLNGQPVTARHIGRLQRGWKWVRRHLLAVALGCSLVVLILIPTVSVIGHYRAQRQIRLKAMEQAPLVREILHRNCFECHGQNPKSIQASLNILDHDLLLDPGRQIVVPGAPADSLLIQRIDDGSMPPEEEEVRLPRLTEQELVVLKDWIIGGAPPLPPDDPEAPLRVPHVASAARAKEIFHTHCYVCHNFDQKDGGIKILHHRLLVNVRRVVVPYSPERSKLFQLLITKDEEKRMPKSTPKNNIPRLSQNEIEDIRQWIEDGAPPFPRGEK